MRITTVPLISKFFGQLDKYTDDLMKVFRHKGGCAGQKIRTIMALTAKVSVFLCIAFVFNWLLSCLDMNSETSLTHILYLSPSEM